jgi:hypothetical protein
MRCEAPGAPLSQYEELFEEKVNLFDSHDSAVMRKDALFGR